MEEIKIKKKIRRRKCLAQGSQRSDAGEARTRGLSVLSQSLYHWATGLPIEEMVTHSKTCVKRPLLKYRK